MIMPGSLLFPKGIIKNNENSTGKFVVVLGINKDTVLLAGTSFPPDDKFKDVIGCCPECIFPCFVVNGHFKSFPYRYSILLDRNNMYEKNITTIAGTVEFYIPKTLLLKLKECAIKYSKLPEIIINSYLL